ncbi:uncharacterized protein [Palaemon carinicauda]|uniref:uncharacterized protein n=1 Tax=Palaemon carinicauda TaxID=392227 RepID=UPI0035B61709
MEMDEIRTEKKPRPANPDLEAGSPTGNPSGEEEEGGGGSEEGEDGEGRVVKKETVVLRLGEGKLTGPMRFITWYAASFTFLVMAGFITWLLMISPPFNVTPVLRPDDLLPHIPPHLKGSTTTEIPPDTEEPEFSSDFNQA